MAADQEDGSPVDADGRGFNGGASTG